MHNCVMFSHQELNKCSIVKTTTTTTRIPTLVLEHCLCCKHCVIKIAQRCYLVRLRSGLGLGNLRAFILALADPVFMELTLCTRVHTWWNRFSPVNAIKCKLQYSIQRPAIQLCAVKFVATVLGGKQSQMGVMVRCPLSYIS